MSKARIAVIGAGLMGHGIAQVFALAGHAVTVYDAVEASLRTVRDRIASNLRDLDQDVTAYERVRPTGDLADAAFAETARFGLIPLRWALGCLLADIGSTTHSAPQVAAIRDDAADTVRRGGGVWSRR